MIDRIQAGIIPKKHHIVFKNDKGELYYEECITRQGFDGPYTICYHENPPQTQRHINANHYFKLPELAKNQPLLKRHLKTFDLKKEHGSAIDLRTPLLFNSDIVISIVMPDAEDPVYFVNGDSDELIYIHSGTGILRTMFGDLRYKELDYVFIPKGILHRWVPDVDKEQIWLSMEFLGALGVLKQFRNEVGQLRMDAPYSHRDFTRPTFTGPIEENIRESVVKKNNSFHGFEHITSPLDVVGFDGSVYPWIFPILNFQPRVSSIHLPPTWHGTFAGRGALVCSFVPRLVDFHKESIPCPYPHSSVDCDEVIFYCHGNFTSRRGIEATSISFHPAGIPHGPHPGAYKDSIGTHETKELAVMIDTFLPLNLTTESLPIDDPLYHNSFV